MAKMQSVCMSSDLDQFLDQNAELKVSFEVPKSSAVQYVSERTTGLQIEELQNVVS